uniref:THAP-type domain-containing protein n=1 Tax=Strigamia maritima TaxID=126957 RepID=T1IXF2_STRMM
MPNHNCCVAICKPRNKRDDVKFIKFPADSILADKWKLVVGRESGFKVTRNTRICSLHFVSGRRSYEPNSIDYIPSIFPVKTVSQIQIFTPVTENGCTVQHMPTYIHSLPSQDGPSTAQYEKMSTNKKLKLFHTQSTPADVECEPDICPANNNFILHLTSNETCMKSENSANQTELRNHEIEKIYETNTRLLNEVQRLKTQMLKISRTQFQAEKTETEIVESSNISDVYFDFEAKNYPTSSPSDITSLKAMFTFSLGEVVKSFDTIR